MKNKSATITFDGSLINCDPSLSILDNLLNSNQKVNYSCKKGTCLTCLLRTDDKISEGGQDTLKSTLVEQGYFLACQANPVDGMTIHSIDQNELFTDTIIENIQERSGQVSQLFLKPSNNFDYRPGQFLNIITPEGEIRSYSIASTPSMNPSEIEIHVKRHEFGKVSRWLSNASSKNSKIAIAGPHGECFYLEGTAEQSLLLIGTGTGLAPLLGIIRDAIEKDHTGPIWLYHGAVNEEGLYFKDELIEMARTYSNLHVNFGVLNNNNTEGLEEGFIQDLALNTHSNLTDWRIYLCGDPNMVKSTKQKVYLAGANLAEIMCDPFDLDTSHNTET